MVALPESAETVVIVSESPSVSVSLATTFTVVELSSFIVAVSGLATGESFTGVTVILSTPEAVSVPSLRV